MFRDLKEYQEIAKIYAEKVSKPENLEERKGSSPEQLAQNRKDAFKGVPNSPSNKRAEMSKKRRGDKKFEFNKPTGGAQGRTRRPEIKKSLPTTAEIRAKDKAAGGTGMSNIPSKEGNAVIDGKKLNPDFGKKVDIKKEFPDKVDPKPLTKKEKFDKKFIRDPKTKTLKRRGSVTARRAENLEKNRLRAQEMAKKRIELKKKAAAEAEAKSKEDIKSSYEYDAYDMVLEYLLSTEQVATIEEANYVMMQLDEENIQEIVGTALKGLKMVGKFGAKGVPQFAALTGTAAALGPSVGKLAYKATETAVNVANKIGNFNPFSGYINKKRDESPLGGNKRVDDTRKKSGENKVGEKIYFK